MLHMCFLGNPGTGKTSVARVVGKIFAEEKILSEKERFVEVHGRDLIAKYVGWTAQATKDKVKQAENGVYTSPDITFGVPSPNFCIV